MCKKYILVKNIPYKYLIWTSKGSKLKAAIVECLLSLCSMGSLSCSSLIIFIIIN